MPAPTVAEVLAALESAARPNLDSPPNTYSTLELQAALGWGKPRTTAFLRAALASGEVVLQPRAITRLDGKPQVVTAYRFVVAPPKRKR